jgi:putative cell wall-binding protein
VKKYISAGTILVLILAVLAPVAPAAAATVASTPRWVGFYLPGVPSDVSILSQRESQVGTHAAVVNFFVSDSESFPRPRCDNVIGHGSIPLITLEFWSTQTGGVSTITNGSRDAYLGGFADAAKALGNEVWLRPFHEMNGDWYPWGGTSANNSPAAVVAAWRHVKDVFTAHGATNVKFVWCVNNDSVPNTSANQIASFWPGDAYVDYVALDGYNAGTTASWSTWRSFGQVMGGAYAKVTGLTQKPLIIAEVSTVEQGGSKAAWVADMFASISSTYTRIKGVIWFDANKEQDWRVDSSAASLAAFKQGVASWAPVAPAPAPAPTPVPVPVPSKRVKRISGPNRYSTAVAISRQSFASADTVVIATGCDYADALAAAPLAGALHAPLLLVPATSVPADVWTEIARLGATKAVIAGGTSAVSGGVNQALYAHGLAIERLAGVNRYETAARLARRTLELTGRTDTTTVIVTRGDSFADALGVSASAYSMRLPILLVRPGEAPAETLQALRDIAPAHVVVVGGPMAVSPGVERAVGALSGDVTRLAGSDRYGTSAAFVAYSVEQGWTDPAHIGLAAGTDFPDALGGGAACGDARGVLLLTAPGALPAQARAFLSANASAITGVSIYGGTGAIGAAVERDVATVCP